jgi:bis(5'-nucleosyl)-tetraphosphatase (symmetrical)
MAIYALGDIQGCYSALQRLTDEIGFNPQQDTLWLVGDLVNRGPDSLGVLRWVKGLGPSAVVVLGNHDLHLLAAAEGVRPVGKGDTFQDILEAPDREDLLSWLRQQRLLYRENDVVLVHAGLLPQWTAREAEALATEVQEVLRGPDYRTLLREMYGSTPAQWSPDLTGMLRCRVIVNALTRLRFCTPGGEMDLQHNGPPESAPPGFLPWFALPNRKNSDVVIVSGHWAAMGLRLTANLLALDSGCVWGQKLSAVRLGDRRLYQVRCGGE